MKTFTHRKGVLQCITLNSPIEAYVTKNVTYTRPFIKMEYFSQISCVGEQILATDRLEYLLPVYAI